MASIPLITARCIEPSAVLAQAFNDPTVSDDEYAALARSIYGEADEEPEPAHRVALERGGML